MSIQFKEKIAVAFSENRMQDLLNQEKINKFEMLAEMLIETNKITNLTAITDEDGIILKHFVDCASIANLIPPCAKVIDVGCGGGFPSLPIAIIRDDIQVVSLDSTGKKIEFVNKAINALDLKLSKAICTRAEEYANSARESFDCAVSRAVARLNVLSELCIPLIKQGGIFIAMKSEKAQEELGEAQTGIKTLGGVTISRTSQVYKHNNREISREIIVVKKDKQTPRQYPRKYAQILKKPL